MLLEPVQCLRLIMYDFSYERFCKYYSKYFQICAHVIFEIRAAYRNDKNDTYNVWDARCFSRILACINIASEGLTTNHSCCDEGLRFIADIPVAFLPSALAVDKNKSPYEPLGTQPRYCTACRLVGHFARFF